MSLDQHLARQHRRLEALATLLTDERQALATGQVDGKRLNDIASHKQALLEELERLETQRRSAQRALGYADHHAGAEQAAQDAGCLDAWHAMREQAEQVRHLNELNGTLLQIRLSHNQRTLNFLHEAAGQSLYGPDGQSHRRGLAGIDSRA
ncbi:flagella synthesis protein FlgN [Litchfieldella rifensis]|uniref:Flagella synthesis protein FlgN n=1 Tax=Litchfieldella rifensis TaxID=762643 RepID=A0ABV7LRV6_9GAMM